MNRKVPLYGVLTALTTAVSLMVVIPIPGTNGLVTLCDAGIYTAGLLFGPMGGMFVGALSGGLIDFLAGYPQWIIFSILIHGAQGWLAGKFSERSRNWQYVGLVFSCLLMVVGYALATGLLYGVVAGVTSIPSNLMQSFFGAAVAVPLSGMLRKTVPVLGQRR